VDLAQPIRRVFELGSSWILVARVRFDFGLSTSEQGGGFLKASAPASNDILHLKLPSETINVPGTADSGSAGTQPGKGYLGR